MADFGAISVMSAPAAKALADPVSTKQPTSGSASSGVSAASSSASSSLLSALSTSGRFRVTVTTRPSRSIFRLFMTDLSGVPDGAVGRDAAPFEAGHHLPGELLVGDADDRLGAE